MTPAPRDSAVTPRRGSAVAGRLDSAAIQLQDSAVTPPRESAVTRPRESAVARVRSAIALSDEQTSRLAESLGRATGKNVEVKVVVDPTVQGGIVAEIGDTVIDGSVRRRLEQLRAAF